MRKNDYRSFFLFLYCFNCWILIILLRILFTSHKSFNIFYKKKQYPFHIIKNYCHQNHKSFIPTPNNNNHNLIKILKQKMCRNICYFMVTTIVLYYIGFDYILDTFATIVSYIPLLHWPLGIIIDFMKSIIHFVPFYYIYVILICIINVFYQFVMT